MKSQNYWTTRNLESSLDPQYIPLFQRVALGPVATALSYSLLEMQKLGPHPRSNELESALLQDPQVVWMHTCNLSSSAVTLLSLRSTHLACRQFSGGVWESELLCPLVGWVPGYHAYPWRKAGSQTMWTDCWGRKSIKALLWEQGMNDGQANQKIFL